MARKKPSSTSSKSRLLKKPVQAYLEPEQAKELKDLSDQTRVPQQAYIREGIELVLEKYGAATVTRRGK